jgi:hypothetical protein
VTEPDMTNFDDMLLVPGERVEIAVISNGEGESPIKQGWTLLHPGKQNSLWWRRSDEGQRMNEISEALFNGYIERVRAFRWRDRQSNDQGGSL